jgi:hypothetical protein
MLALHQWSNQSVYLCVLVFYAWTKKMAALVKNFVRRKIIGFSLVNYNRSFHIECLRPKINSNRIQIINDAIYKFLLRHVLFF